MERLTLAQGQLLVCPTASGSRACPPIAWSPQLDTSLASCIMKQSLLHIYKVMVAAQNKTVTNIINNADI